MRNAPKTSADVRVGISGWRYKPWRGTFYPKGLPQKDELSFAARQLNSIEINGTHYSLQRPASFESWYRQTPGDFIFSVKSPRFITHMKKLRDVDGALANFFAQGLFALREKMGPILWQFGANLGFDEPRFEAFFNLLPRDTRSAARFAEGHATDKVKGRAFYDVDENRPLRYAVEFRNKSFLTPAFPRLLRKHDIALVVADTAKTFPYLEDVTAAFVYVRLHGDEQLYASGYSDAALDHWARRINLWRAGREPTDAVKGDPAKKPARRRRDVYVYFDNDIKVKAPPNAIDLMRRLGR